jgi:UDP-N-acetylmuramoyl-tripeptide--D-alanyl-D-alanine ligase
MGRTDPFWGYSLLLRTLVFVVVPAFAVHQAVRLRRALHVFQLEGYKRHRLRAWLAAGPSRRLFLRPVGAKKPLVMTGRAWRLLLVSLAITVLGILGASGLVHINLGFPADVATFAAVTILAFVFMPEILLAADIALVPVQGAINAHYRRAARRKLTRLAPLVIGVTGSYGKTSTKFAIAALVAPDGQALATPGSYNTPLGVCRTINELLEPRHRAFVVEMGAYGVGEIAELSRFVRHRIGVLTAIGPVHLERFGSMEAIRRGKYEIVTELPPDGVAVMNSDDEEVRALADSTVGVRVVRYGIDPAGRPDVTARDLEVSARGSSFTVVAPGHEPLRVTTRLLGRHAIGHVLAGVAVALEAGRDLIELGAPIAALAPVEHRLQLIEGAGGVTVIDDAFNSNPAGAAAALEVLAQMPARRRVVVTPGIIELGPLAEKENRRFGRSAAEVADVVIFVAALNRAALVAGAEGGRAEVITVDSLAQATEVLKRIVGPGDVVLFENDLPDQLEG